MKKRLMTMTGAAAALAALALGGSSIATAAHGKAVKKAGVENTRGPDTDNIQSGDQLTPDVSNAKQSTASSSESASEASAENSESTEAPSDGPGGHEDPAGMDVETQE